MLIEQVMKHWLGTAEQCEAILKFARDYNWEEYTDGVAGPENEAIEITLGFAGEGLDLEAFHMMVAALVDSAERYNARLWFG